MSTDQLATQAVDALAAVRNLQAPNNEHPMRHVVRSLKREAESILENAFRQAIGLTLAANDAITDYDKAQEEAAQTKKDGVWQLNVN